ncbi:MAG: NAD-glutamate dehydrogenase [Bauldia sp.]
MRTGGSGGEARRRLIVAAARRALAGTGDTELLTALAGDLYARTSIEDLAVYAPAEIAAFVGSAGQTLSRRKPGSHLIRLSDPEVSGRARRHRDVTLVEIANDNMPFLVDSVLGEIHDFGVETRLVAHPIVTVTRDGEGRLTDYQGPVPPAAGAVAIRESLIQVHIDRLVGDEPRRVLVERLDQVLEQVRRAVEGWRPMRERLAQAIDAYRATPPPIPADDREEAIAFLEWLLADNFALLGIREYDFMGNRRTGELRRRDTPGLGILSDPSVRVLSRGGEAVTTTPAVREFLMRPEALIITKTNIKSRVHRRVYMDYVGVKLFAEKGRLAGELRVIGLFTATAYTHSTRDIPLLRRKVARIVAGAGLDPESHSGKVLVNVLESYPRDELFQIDEDVLAEFAQEIIRLEERPRVRALVRADKFDRFVSVIVFVPRDRYDSSVRERIGGFLADAFDGRLSAFYPAFPEGMSLARVHFIIGRSGGNTPRPERTVLEAGLAGIIRTWTDGLRFRLFGGETSARAMTLVERYQEAFPAAYRDDFAPEAAVADIEAFERLTAKAPLSIEFRPPDRHRADAVRLKLIHLATPIALSERVPMLENMGFRVIDERSYEIAPAGDCRPIHVHDMALAAADGGAIDLGQRAAALTDCLSAVWHGQAENDGYNALVLNAGLAWREAALLRSVSRYLRQAGTPYSQHYMWSTLGRHRMTAGLLVKLFGARFDPDGNDAAVAAQTVAAIEATLEAVDSLDEDRIIRRFAGVIGAMVRTNFFQRSAGGVPRAEISFKLDSAKLEELPEPKPFREIFVHSPRLEGVHLRFGKVARGGIRWSDRAYDFRTEVLGLAKAQQVKNAVIVPVGAKGGFVPYRLPAGGNRDEILSEGTAAYSIFISSLLDITDNLDGETVVPPERVVRHDDDDTYLVVAADKGTATFSDIANRIADDHRFWLSDAFASGGSAGYDHKAMGITARGAWEAVKRHFRERDTDIQATPFTVIGVGDMSGDVFGNAMLLSGEIRLVAAFDHRDLFVDPTPDPAASLMERRRLFGLPRSSWQDYDRGTISEGGGVFSRRDKAVRLTREMRALTGLVGDRAAPHDLIRAILKAKVDLLWFGGIGTFVRASEESDERVGDRANDAIRITAAEIGARVVGEGANLAMTQRARIEFGLAGGACNSDAIDNSAGVNTSDLEVNIKIALRPALADGRIDRRRRNRLLKAMTGDVARLVLRNNYLQTLTISLAERRGFEDFGFQLRLMQELEARGRLNRAVESLPDDAAMAERQKAGKPLTRAEIGVLIAYAKIVLHDDLMASDVTDDPGLEGELIAYFPEPMRLAFAGDIAGHPLRREIIATVLANAMINQGGPTYLMRAAERTGATAEATARAYVAMRDSFAVEGLNRAIDGLDARVSGDAQMALYRAVQNLVITGTAWFLRNVALAGGIGAVVATYAPAAAEVGRALDALLPQRLQERVDRETETYGAAGVPENLARRIATLPTLAHAPDIHLAAAAAGCGLRRATAVYLAVAEHLKVARVAALARALPVTDHYDGLALSRALETLDVAHRRISIAALQQGGDEKAPLDAWLTKSSTSAQRVLGAVSAIADGEEVTVSRVIVAAELLADLARGAPQ